MAGAAPGRLAGLVPASPDGRVVLFADASALRRVAEALRAVGDEPWTVPLADPPAPAAAPLRRLVLRRSDGLARIAVAGDEVQISGAPEPLRRLALDLDLFAERGGGEGEGGPMRVDQEWPAAVLWLAADTVPLVVAGWHDD
jgi:hypothetical protein